jgi:hypothetical protein
MWVCAGGLICGACVGRHPAAVAMPVELIAQTDWPKGVTIENLKDSPVPEIGGEGLAMSDGTNTVAARTWREFDRLSEAGLEPASNAELSMSAWFYRRRGFIPFMEKAQPAKTSFVRDLPMNRKLPALLDPDLAPAVSQEESDFIQQAKREGKSWQQAYPETRVKRTRAAGKRGHLPFVSFQTDHGRVSITPLAYGDYDHDGFEDVLVFVVHDMDPGTLTYGFTAILTRKNAKERFSIVRPGP